MGRLYLYQTVAAVLYVVVARACLRTLPNFVGRPLFALWNVLGVMCFWFWSPTVAPNVVIGRTAVYVTLVLIHYALMRRMQASRARTSWPAIVYPIALLFVFKYTEALWAPIAARHGLSPQSVQRDLLATFVGISYVAFRLSHFTVEVRNGVVRMPTVWEHISFTFFVPTLPVGPISPGSLFLTSLDTPRPEATPVGRSLLRILVGATKYLFLAGAIGHLTYVDLLDDGHPHAGPIDWIVSGVGYYMYLYCNFSGFCDMAIGGAGLMGISIVENFDMPLVVRNITEFWRHWHISLTMYVREMFFSPMSKVFARAVGPTHTNHAVALALFLTLVLTGIWHGAGLNFLYFGVFHGVGMVTHHYYTILLRKRLSRPQFKRYQESAAVRAAAVVVTFSFVTVSLFILANDVSAMRRIAHVSAQLPERPQ